MSRDDARCADAMEQAHNVVLATLTDKLPAIEVSTATVGHVLAHVDPDGILRKYIPAITGQANSQLLPSLGLAALETFSEKAKHLERTQIKDFSVTQEPVLLTFIDPSSFVHYSAAQILAEALRIKEQDEASNENSNIDVSDAAVFIGITAPGLLDKQATPLNPAQPGMEIHATFFSDAVSNSFMDHVPLWIELSSACVVAALGSGMPLGKKRLWTLVGLIGAGLLPFFASIVLFPHHLFYNPFVALFGGLGAFIAAITVGYYAEGRQRSYLRKVFSQYLSSDVIDTLVTAPHALALGGTSKIITALFTDMQGFTSISEKLAPQELVRFMNDYLDIVSEAIFAQKGTLDKYVGDAVMAFWNAPLDIVDHAWRACCAAVDIQKRLGQQAEIFQQRYGSVPITRIGIATGPAVVGNLGSAKRFAYTAVGDSINIASRLEQANKVLGTSILTERTTVLELVRTMDIKAALDPSTHQSISFVHSSSADPASAQKSEKMNRCTTIAYCHQWFTLLDFLPMIQRILES